MAKIHVDQITKFQKQAESSDPLGFIFWNEALVGIIEDTSESSVALNLLDQPLTEEEYPQSGYGDNDHYYRLSERIESAGFRVIDAEWWKTKLDKSYSILSLP